MTPQHNEPTADGVGTTLRWDAPGWALPFTVAVLGLLVVGGAIGSGRVATGGGAFGIAFIAAWWAILAWNVYWFMFRVAYRLELRGETLHWRAQLARGELPGRSITAVAVSRGQSPTVTIRAAGRRSVRVMFGHRSLSSVLEPLHAINAAVPADIGGSGDSATK
ncbi:hypothetical protein [Agromyces bracchium]|uniref:Uncharacterized protein n=1 Tax=Agromyces bracchium TaxID=88376 RepID=A0A6I3M0M3_9MICO|nr:hypothetical protein [Agromyces bracchium]MTH67089.1 hypothetical protein [Agromyces bracchium]